MKQLTVLSFGGGQDSTALLLLYINDANFRLKYAPGDLVVIMSDTGDEHRHTKLHMLKIRELCDKHQIPFFHLTADMGYHVQSWPDLITPQVRACGGEFKPTMVQLGTKTCTLQLKIGPIYKFLDEWINEKYGYGFKIQPRRGCLKQAINRFGEENGKIRVLIGFAYGEESRMEKSLKQQAKDYEKANSFWKHIVRDFPLVDLKMGRKECQHYIASNNMVVPYPSNCVRCPYMSPEELLWMSIHEPMKLMEWVEIEAAKIQRYAGEEKNHGVFNTKKLIPERLADVQKKYANMPLNKLAKFLDDYKMNHGCGSGGH